MKGKRLLATCIFVVAYSIAISFFLLVAGSDLVFSARWPFYDEFDEPPLSYITLSFAMVASAVVYPVVVKCLRPVDRRSELSAGFVSGMTATTLVFAIWFITLGAASLSTSFLKPDYVGIAALPFLIFVGVLYGSLFVLVPMLPFGIVGGLVGSLGAVAIVDRRRSRKSRYRHFPPVTDRDEA
jgi:hypothetical protein